MSFTKLHFLCVKSSSLSYPQCVSGDNIYFSAACPWSFGKSKNLKQIQRQEFVEQTGLLCIHRESIDEKVWGMPEPNSYGDEYRNNGNSWGFIHLCIDKTMHYFLKSPFTFPIGFLVLCLVIFNWLICTQLNDGTPLDQSSLDNVVLRKKMFRRTPIS